MRESVHQRQQRSNANASLSAFLALFPASCLVLSCAQGWSENLLLLLNIISSLSQHSLFDDNYIALGSILTAGAPLRRVRVRVSGSQACWTSYQEAPTAHAFPIAFQRQRQRRRRFVAVSLHLSSSDKHHPIPTATRDTCFPQYLRDLLRQRHSSTRALLRLPCPAQSCDVAAARIEFWQQQSPAANRPLTLPLPAPPGSSTEPCVEARQRNQRLDSDSTYEAS